MKCFLYKSLFTRACFFFFFYFGKFSFLELIGKRNLYFFVVK